MPAFDASQFRQAFPAINDNYIYFDSAATALKPAPMIKAIEHYYSTATATVNRSLHPQAQAITSQTEQARSKVAQLLNAATAQQIIWSRGTTESLNLVANSYALPRLQPGDEIIVSELEHHSNLIPWLMVAGKIGAKVVKWPVNKRGELQLNDLQQRLNARTKIVAVSQMSNLTGFQIDLAGATELAHQHQAVIVVDGAQGIVHNRLDVQALDIDFYAFSAHKLYGPTGLGVLYAKAQHLEQMSLWHGGGKMLTNTTFEEFTSEAPPNKFEAGTPHIAGQLGLLATLNWAENIDWPQAEYYTCQLADLAQQQLQSLSQLTLYRAPHSPVIAFSVAGIHHSDIGIVLAEHNIALRTGKMCAQPLLIRLGHAGLIRISLAPYNTAAEVAQFIDKLQQTLTILS